MGAHVSDMTHAMDLIAARATSDSAFSDADARCRGRSWPLYLLGLKLRPSQRKRPTTTTAETKKGPASCCFGKSRGLRQWSLWPCVCGRLTSHANSSVGCFSPWSFVFSACLCCLWRQWISGLNELGQKKKKKTRWKKKVEGEGPDLSTAGPPIG